MTVDLVVELKNAAKSKHPNPMMGMPDGRGGFKAVRALDVAVAELERMRAEVEWWHKYDSELRDNNPCPDLALRHMYLQNARKAARGDKP